MGSCLIVGRLPSSTALDGARAYLARALDAGLTNHDQAQLCKLWNAAPEEVAYFDFLNVASTCAFLDHTAKLEGFTDANEALARSRWRHLPYWIESYWLPVRSDTTSLDGPVFFGSAYGLLANLAAIATTSPYGLGTVPPHFEMMRTDPRSFYALQLDAFDEQATLQWIWRALFEAATLSVERNIPLWSG
jgi:hypothetical protein